MNSREGRCLNANTTSAPENSCERGVLADYNSLMEMDVAAWCLQNSHAGCHGAPPRFVWV